MKDDVINLKFPNSMNFKTKIVMILLSSLLITGNGVDVGFLFDFIDYQYYTRA